LNGLRKDIFSRLIIAIRTQKSRMQRSLRGPRKFRAAAGKKIDFGNHA